MDKPDYAFWDEQEHYTEDEAAALCCDMEPPSWGVSGPINRKMGLMGGRLFQEVPRAVIETPGGWGKGFLRKDLRRWAEDTGQRGAMPFLFPEDRKTRSRAHVGAVSEREEASVLEILGAILQATYGDDILEDLTAPRSQRFKEVFEDVTRKTKISEDTLRKYLKRIPR